MNYLLIRFSWIFLHFFLNEGGCKFCLMKHVNFISIFFWTLLHWNIIALQKNIALISSSISLIWLKVLLFWLKGWQTRSQVVYTVQCLTIWNLHFILQENIISPFQYVEAFDWFGRTLFHYLESFAILVERLTNKVAGCLSCPTCQTIQPQRPHGRVNQIWQYNNGDLLFAFTALKKYFFLPTFDFGTAESKPKFSSFLGGFFLYFCIYNQHNFLLRHSFLSVCPSGLGSM